MISLTLALRVNALSCITFGFAFVVFAQTISVFLSNSAPASNPLVQALGVVLIINGALLIWTAQSANPSKFWVSFFALGDTLWVMTTLVLISTGLWITDTAGIATALGVAGVVGFLGYTQWYHTKYL